MVRTDIYEADIKVAVFTQQISHYHSARYRATAELLPKLTVISAMNDAEFPEFLAPGVSGFANVRLFEGKTKYLKAIGEGEVWGASYDALEKIRPDVVAVAGWSSPESFSAIAWARENS